MDDIKVTKNKKSNASEDVLIVNNIEVVYSHVILVLKGVSLNVKKGGITALLGGNGAGKSTTLKSISNLLASERGEVKVDTRSQLLSAADGSRFWHEFDGGLRFDRHGHAAWRGWL